MFKKQIKHMLSRLRSPSVVMGIVSQIIVILTLLNVSVDVNVITGIAVAVCSIMVFLGIMKNPNTKKMGVLDEIHWCEHCKKDSVHYRIAGKLVCSECGAEHIEGNIISNNSEERITTEIQQENK